MAATAAIVRRSRWFAGFRYTAGMQFPARKNLALVVVSLTLGACGLKAPLYLPDERKEEVTAPSSPTSSSSKLPSVKRRTPPPAPQSQKEDRAQQPPVSAGDTTPPVSVPDPDRPANPPPPVPR